MKTSATSTAKKKVAVLDMQPITPAVGGGRLRVLGLYHALGPEFETTYVGTYDWPGEGPRQLRLSESLVEIDVPLSAEHFRRDAQWRDFAHGATVIDATFPILGRLSDDFLTRARAASAEADVVIFSHPWLYPLLADGIDRQRQLLAYDAQNAEGLLRHELLGGSPFGRELARGAAMAEAFLCRAADLVIGCSAEDLDFFSEVYGISRRKTTVIHNGVFVASVVPRATTSSEEAKSAVGIAGPVAIFVGSNYRPNEEAANFIVGTLAPAMPEMLFLICGGVGHGMSPTDELPRNVRCTGSVSDDDKLRFLQASDVAVNPMSTGSGTNIKMFEFMAAGLPVVSTKIGARGICDTTTQGVIVCSPNEMTRVLRRIMSDDNTRRRLGSENRSWVEKEFAWESLSPSLGKVVAEALERHAAVNRHTEVVRSAPGNGHPDGQARGVDSDTGTEPRIAILSTFGIRCGIAEYTTHLAEALLGAGADLTIVANVMEGHDDAATSTPETLNPVPVERVWRYDAAAWAKGGANAIEVVRVLRVRKAAHLNVQYHRAFFSEEALLDLVQAVIADGVSVSLTMHNSRDAAVWFLQALAQMRVPVLLHQAAEERRLREIGIHARHLPQGVRAQRSNDMIEFPVRSEDVGQRPLIASFGFLRPHKGLVELVEALSILRGVFPGIRLLAQTSLYPSPDSAEYLEQVRQRIEALALRDAVILDKDFLPIQAVIDRLSRADLIVLPYAASDEGSSAAAATALAARRPLVTTQAAIFDDVRSAAYAAEDNTPPVLAAAIATVLSNGALCRHLEHQSRRLADARDWRNVAKRLIEMIEKEDRFEPAGRANVRDAAPLVPRGAP